MPCHSFDLSPAIDFDSARMFSIVIFEVYFSYHKDIWIAAVDHYLHQGSIIFMTICLFVCLFTSLLVGLRKHHWLDLNGKKTRRLVLVQL